MIGAERATLDGPEAYHYDLAIIGSGGGAFAAAIASRRRDLRLVMIERGTVGGTCVNIGCIPSKALLAAAEARQVARLMRAAGLSGLVRRRKGKTAIRVPGIATAPDLVRRDFAPAAPNRLWVADLTEFATLGLGDRARLLRVRDHHARDARRDQADDRVRVARYAPSGDC